MPRLYRPVIPIEIKCRVILRQLGEIFIDDVIRLNRFVPRESVHRRSLARLLAKKQEEFASLLGCTVPELRLDHDPPLAARPKHRRGLGKKTFYIPDANDPDHLFYRPHGPQHAKSHLIKTNVRGDHGQHPDRVLIKKARKLERGPKPKRAIARFSAKNPKQKTKWASRPFPRRRP
jgi:hypothetical protein